MLRDLEFADNYINFNDLNIYEQIGEGSISRVFRAVDQNTQKEISLKIIKSRFYDIPFFLKVIDSLKLLNLPSFIKILGYEIYLPDSRIPDFLKNLFDNNIFDDNHIYFVIFEELMKNGNLAIYLREGDNFLTPTSINKIIFGVSSTLKFLHKHKILFRDLKPYHIYLDENFEPKISFCSLITIVNEDEEEELNDPVGTIKYMAPEILNEQSYSFPSDVYSFSMILTDFLSKTIHFSLKNKMLGKYPNKPNNVSDGFWELIQKCWAFDPNKRPSFEEITEMLKNDKFLFRETGMEIDYDELHKYQKLIESHYYYHFYGIPEKFSDIMNKV